MCKKCLIPRYQSKPMYTLRKVRLDIFEVLRRFSEAGRVYTVFVGTFEECKELYDTL